MGRNKKKSKQTSHIQDEIIPNKPIEFIDALKSIWCFPLCSVLLLMVILSLRVMNDIDIGFHLHGGEWIWNNKTFPNKDAYTYTVSQNDYIDMHWLYQLIIFAVYSISGFEGISIMNSLFILTALILLFSRFLALGIAIPISLSLLIAIGLILEIRFVVRPEVLTWSFLLLTLIILDQYQQEKKNRLWLLVVIHLVWVNMQGLFILGWGVMGIYCLSNWVHQKKIDWELWRWCISAGAICILNPYHIEGVMFPFYLFTRLRSENVFKGHISEFISPFDIKPTDNLPFISTIPITLFYAFSFITILLILFTIKKRKLHEFLLFAVFFYLSASQIRNIPLFPLVLSPILLASANDFYKQFIGNQWVKSFNSWANSKQHVLALGLMGFAVMFSIRVISNAYYESDRRFIQFGVGISEYFHPFRAAAFLNEHHLDGKIINDLNSGATLGWKLKQQIFIDGRLEVMRERFFSVYAKSFESGGLEELIRLYQPDLVVFDFLASASWNQQLKQLSDWRMIYVDDLNAIYARKGYAENVPSFSFDQSVTQLGVQASFSEKERLDVLSLPETSAISRWFSGFWEVKPYPYQLSKLGVYAYQTGELACSERCYLDYIKQTRGALHESYFNLGSLYYKMQRFQLAKLCYEKFIRLGGSHPLAQKRIIEIVGKH